MDILGFFNCEEEKLLQQTDRLQEVMNHLRYEGKVFRGKNLKAANRIVEGIAARLEKHRILQEKIIFHFLQVHIPKRESMVRFLFSDHEDIQKNKERLRLSLRKLSRNHSPEDGKVQQWGTYLICLLRLHIELERESIHKAIRTELRKDEKKEVEKRVTKWLLKQPGHQTKQQIKKVQR